MDKKLLALEKFTRNVRLSENQRRYVENMSPLERFALNARLVRDDECRERHRAYIADMIAFKHHPPTVPSVAQASALVQDALAQHGFSHSYQIDREGETITVTCEVTHRQGHSESATLRVRVPADELDDSSTVTYLQGLTLLNVTGLFAEDQLA